ncbi:MULTISPECIES: hypothetical protein [Planktothricoides]|uniref:Uncharacterized protein n=1 Tax=Planktothricoides raciborskii GIHE-MW2 TaxID=2792601 RepID=A0AAU8JAS5_9CYAN|nr:MULTISPECIES: hypothetical protein [Planktothricoides]MBD2581851.1 hypothetical protein [Planktothricoides raciborskii FACHB-1261]
MDYLPLVRLNQGLLTGTALLGLGAIVAGGYLYNISCSMRYTVGDRDFSLVDRGMCQLKE